MLTRARYRSTQKPRTFRGPRGKFNVQVRKVFKTKCLLDLIIACLQGKIGTVSARNICNTARIRKGYHKWSQKRPLVEKSTVESDIPVKRVTRSATVRASAKEIITIKFSSMQ